MTDVANLPENFYARKLYAFLRSGNLQHEEIKRFGLSCLELHLPDLENWWDSSTDTGQQARGIGSSSDRVNLKSLDISKGDIKVKHPISGQDQQISRSLPKLSAKDIPKAIRTTIQSETSPKKMFWWFWRFYPELLAKHHQQALLYPAHPILTDCPLHSYQATVSALVGALSNTDAKQAEDQTPYLLLFSFSPVQEFIKASRKFLDFWAGSYLLHYLSARLCWHVAKAYGPDSIIVPSLWGQDIIDAFLLKEAYPDFADFMQRDIDLSKSCEIHPVAERFNAKESNSLSTAGFPNMITVLVPGKAAAQKLGTFLAENLQAEWRTISDRVKTNVRQQVIKFLTDPDQDKARAEFWREFEKTLPRGTPLKTYQKEVELLLQQSCWEWKHLWKNQIEYTWEPYWAAVPLGNPEQPQVINRQSDEHSEDWSKRQEDWAKRQDAIAWPPNPLPSEAEKGVYTQKLNVGTWWGSLQQRLRTAHMAVKNTRHWQIPAGPGPRSTLSGQFSALHPRLNYQTLKRNGETKDFREGGGLPESSMRLFWLLMSYTYKGLFNGSEMLNALELTKRMAWQFGGVAESMGISTSLDTLKPEDYEQDDRTELQLQQTLSETDYEQLIRFPNLSSIAAARFIHESYNQPNSKLRAYWRVLRHKIGSEFGNPEHRYRFAARTRGRPTQVPKTDRLINPPPGKAGQNYNGVMFSSKWLADELNLEKRPIDGGEDEVAILRRVVNEVHRHKEVGFGEGSPGDWWVIVLGDGDGMGSYISGEKLLKYEKYINFEAVDQNTPGFDLCNYDDFVSHTQKRMGPATHIGLNRALLDFSNRLVPYLTEKRYCGRVIYSGGDDVMAVLPLEDLPRYLRSLRAAWCGGKDPEGEFEPHHSTAEISSEERREGSGYWHPKESLEGIPLRPHFTMGEGATMSLGIVIANKTVPLPTVLENLWDAEKTAKAMPKKDGLCFRVIYGSGNVLEAKMKGHLLDGWWKLLKDGGEELSPLLYRLSEELPRRACITPDYYLFAEAAKVIAKNRDESRQTDNFEEFCDNLYHWLRHWEDWARGEIAASYPGDKPPGTQPEDLGRLLRFSAFWVDKNVQRRAWVEPVKPEAES